MEPCGGCWVVPDSLADVPPDVALWLVELLRDPEGAAAVGWDPRLKIVAGPPSPCPSHLLEEEEEEEEEDRESGAASPDSGLCLTRSRTLDSLDDLPLWPRDAVMDSPRSSGGSDDSSDSDRSVDSLEEEGVGGGGSVGVDDDDDSPCRVSPHLRRDAAVPSRCPLPVLVEEDEEDVVSSSDDDDDDDDNGTVWCSEDGETLVWVSDEDSTTPVASSASASRSDPCAEALESAEALCRDLCALSRDDTLSQSFSVDEDMVFDEDFLALCSEANRLAEACLDAATTTVGPARPDVNAIFDREGAGQPRAPLRRRRLLRSEESAPEQEQSEQDQPEQEQRPAEEDVEVALMTRACERTLLKRSRSHCSGARCAAELRDPETCPSDAWCAPEGEEAPSQPADPTEGRDRDVPAVDPTLVDRRQDFGRVEPIACSDPVVFGSSMEQEPNSELRSGVLSDCNDADLLGTKEERVVTISSEMTAAGAELQSDRTDTCVIREQTDGVRDPIRKGSVSSDVVAWKDDLLWSGLHSDEENDEPTDLCMESKQWFSSSDNRGRVYFFEENSSESSWNLPEVKAGSDQNHLDPVSPHQKTSSQPQKVLPPPNSAESNEKTVKNDFSEKNERISVRAAKSRSMFLVDSSEGKGSKTTPPPRNWPQLFEGDMCVLKEGPMYRTKITENGKKLRKNWAPAHVVLTELFLLLFRDAKTFVAMKSAAPGNASYRPELCVDLNGALIDQVDRGDKASVTSRKNVFLVSTVLGLQVLFQCDCGQVAEEWYNAVHTAIHNLPSGFDSCPRIKVTKEMDRLFSESNSPEQTKKFPRIGRSKSVKIKNKEGSIEDLTVSPAERQTKIRARLKKFFNRRPTMESLVKKGIWKDEPAFGCYLEQVCGNESPRVPVFVQKCITVIEGNIDNMKTDGLYRASGNLSQVQKIRLQVDQNNMSALDQEEDVHVLTGALKLFFRELKEPLIPYTAFSKAIKASTNPNRKEKLVQFRDIVKSLPTANHDTLKFLLRHLLRVTSYQEFNRMHIPNLAIVFGPTLMWPEQESLNMALDLMQQNLVIETFLLDFENIFR